MLARRRLPLAPVSRVMAEHAHSPQAGCLTCPSSVVGGAAAWRLLLLPPAFCRAGPVGDSSRARGEGPTPCSEAGTVMPRHSLADRGLGPGPWSLISCSYSARRSTTRQAERRGLRLLALARPRTTTCGTATSQPGHASESERSRPHHQDMSRPLACVTVSTGPAGQGHSVSRGRL